LEERGLLIQIRARRDSQLPREALFAAHLAAGRIYILTPRESLLGLRSTIVRRGYS